MALRARTQHCLTPVGAHHGLPRIPGWAAPSSVRQDGHLHQLTDRDLTCHLPLALKVGAFSSSKVEDRMSKLGKAAVMEGNYQLCFMKWEWALTTSIHHSKRA